VEVFHSLWSVLNIQFQAQQKTIADFTRVVEQTGILERGGPLEPLAPMNKWVGKAS
jgi:hypothetical protein